MIRKKLLVTSNTYLFLNIPNDTHQPLHSSDVSGETFGYDDHDYHGSRPATEAGGIPADELEAMMCDAGLKLHERKYVTILPCSVASKTVYP